MNVERLIVALRVLHSITEYHQPNPEDVAFLRSCAPPYFQASPEDELACNVVLIELNKRKGAGREEGGQRGSMVA